MGYVIVGGGQYGSEGKGKVASFLAQRLNAEVVCRVGGSNSGHTVYHNGKKFTVRMLPTAAITTNADIVFPAGTYIDADVLMEEVKQYGIDYGRIMIDKRSVVITEKDKIHEQSDGRGEYISSTLSGTGAAVVKRANRHTSHIFAGDHEVLKDFVCDTFGYLRQRVATDQCVVIEGTQGYGLSLLHTDYYPYCTSRSTTAAAFLMEVGGSIRDVDRVVTVFRSYPIRVGGDSGPLPFEMTWEEVTREAGAPSLIQEYTTVTGKLRRVARINPPYIKKVIAAERPNMVVMNHLDYIDWANKDNPVLSDKQLEFIERIEEQIGSKINLAGNGCASMIDMC